MWIAGLILVIAAPLSAPLNAAELGWLDEPPQFLPVDEAFVLSTEVGQDGALLAYWDMPDGYYLYRHRFDFKLKDGSAATLGPAQIPPGEAKVDEYFGAVEVYYRRAEARVPVKDAVGPIEVGVAYQGCADAGLCYPPETRWVVVDPSASAATLQQADDLAAAVSAASEVGYAAAVQSLLTTAEPSLSAAEPQAAIPKTEERRLASLLAEGGVLAALAIFFLGGVGLAFTPCVLPMVPILSSIIVGDKGDKGGKGGKGRFRALTLSVAYVLGMACTYAVVGTLMGLFGASLNLQASLQSPPVLIAFALVFMLLSLSMFGFYELRLPQRWQNALDSWGRGMGGGKHLSVVVMGALSALVVSPCVSAPLAGALVYISATNDGLFGGAALLSLGLGMGVPLLVIGAGGGRLIPRAGPWMDAIKALFGVLLLAVSIWLLERVLPPAVTLALWASLLIGCAAYLGGLDAAPKQGWGQLWKALGFAGAVYGVLLLVGAASGADDPLRPLRSFTASQDGAAELVWQPVKGLNDLKAEIGAGNRDGRLVLLDVYADWCISCKILERSVFPRPEVADRLVQFHLLRADVTANDAQDKTLLSAFGLFGPPSLVFFGSDGVELTTLRVQGEIGAKALVRHLDGVLASG